MFERVFARVSRSAERRRRERIEMLAEHMRAAVPGDIEVEPAPEGVRLAGRDLKRRFALDPAMRWLTAVLR
jgi:hypothetical protein